MELSEKALHVATQMNKLNYSDEIGIMKLLIEKYKLQTISQYSKEKDLQRMGIYRLIESGKLPSIELMNQTFIIEM